MSNDFSNFADGRECLDCLSYERENKKLLSDVINLKKELDTVIKIGVEGQREINRKLSEENKKLMAREEIYKSIIKKQAEVLEHYKQDFDHDPSEDEIEKDYDCGCCSVGAAGARAFVVLKEVSKMMEEIEGEK